MWHGCKLYEPCGKLMRIMVALALCFSSSWPRDDKMRMKEWSAWRILCARVIKSARLLQKRAGYKLRGMRGGQLKMVLFSMYYLVNL